MTMLEKAVAYYRTSSDTNVNGDSRARQEKAIMDYAEVHGLEVVAAFYDPGVSGSTSIFERPAFGEMLEYLSACDECTTILVENATRFSRDLVIQELGFSQLQEAGLMLVPVDSPDHFLSDNPTSAMVRQILGAVSQFEKAQVVAKLRGARSRKQKATGKGVGRKSLVQIHGEEIYTAAKRLHRKPRNGKRPSLRTVAQGLAEMGYTQKSGKPLAASQVQRLINEGREMVTISRAVSNYETTRIA